MKIIGSCCFAVCLAVVGFVTETLHTNYRAEFDNVNPTEMEIVTTKNSDLFRQHGIQIVLSSDPDFEVNLKQYLGIDSDEFDKVIKITKPFSLIVVNRASKEVIGCAIRWEFVNASGQVSVFPQIVSSPGVLMGMKPSDPRMIGKTSIIPVKNSRFFSFDYGVEQTLLNWNMKRDDSIYRKIALTDRLNNRMLDGQANKNRLLSMFSGVTVSLDGVFFSDGTFIGEDTFFMFDAIRGEVQARIDLAKQLSDSYSKRADLKIVLDEFVSERSNMKRSRNLPENTEEAYRRGYEEYTNLLRKEISKRRTIVSDQIIAHDILLNTDLVPRPIIKLQ